MTWQEQAKQSWVRDFQHIEADAVEFVKRAAVEPFQYIDCLATPSGSSVHGFICCHKLGPNIYRMIYIVRYPGGTEYHLGEGEALFEGEAAKLETKYGTPHMEPWTE